MNNKNFTQSIIMMIQGEPLDKDNLADIALECARLAGLSDTEMLTMKHKLMTATEISARYERSMEKIQSEWAIAQQKQLAPMTLRLAKFLQQKSPKA